MFIHKTILILVLSLACINSYAEEKLKNKDTKLYTAKDVSIHNTKKSCWVIIDRKVFDVTAFLTYHPGPFKILFNCCGKDCTERFKDKFIGESHSKKAVGMRDKMLIGNLKESK